jgi:hypothetical protein
MGGIGQFDRFLALLLTKEEHRGNQEVVFSDGSSNRLQRSQMFVDSLEQKNMPPLGSFGPISCVISKKGKMIPTGSFRANYYFNFGSFGSPLNDGRSAPMDL